MHARGWRELDILIVSGDAYVDHPAFGPVLIARFLEGRGYKVGVIAQPKWDSPEDIARMGRPRLFVGVAAGNLDSMLNKLTAQKKVRSEDQYSPGGRANMRPNRATIVYSNLCRQAFPGLPVVLGGIEASLRRIAHYDYWSDQVRRSILLDAKADLLVFGMGERPAWEIAKRLDAGEPVSALTNIRGTAHVKKNRREWEPLLADQSRFVLDKKLLVLPSYDEVVKDKEQFAKMSRALQYETNPHNGRPLLQVHGEEAVYFNSPAEPLDESEMDGLYDLPFARAPHPSYKEPIPAFNTVKDSIVTMRGCFGGCTFCSITEHEGRIIQSRSEASVLREVRQLSRMEGFSGVLTDLGGPTANMYKMTCKDERTENACRRLSCVHPGICENLVTDHAPLISLMRKVRSEKGIKRVFIASGVRYDLAERSPEFIRELAQHHTGGQLSVAPEHSNDDVLDKMKKPSIKSYERFAQQFCQASEEAGKEQFLVPYFITGHPGSTLKDTIELAIYLKNNGMRPRQVQDFIPTPMAVATTMFYTGLDPLSGDQVYTARDLREKRMMKALIFYWDAQHWPLAREALVKAGRRDLIGRGPEHLVPPEGAADRLARVPQTRGPARSGPPNRGPARGPASNAGPSRGGPSNGRPFQEAAPRARDGRPRDAQPHDSRGPRPFGRGKPPKR
ncbi:Fe-S oxidoreductase [Labilithrix luteola]|uniref:Fe-S oxidoreductase n=2 Tax=Labilithrix luteola TaxID=1391654 RepID=A0A0K1PZP7_9BACT|nr:Fe-S oxidoreductase [Labilithrix luteola]